MGLRVSPENSLSGTQVIVDAFVVLVNVAAGAIAGHKVPIRVAYLIGLWKVRQKRLSRRVDAVGGNAVAGEGGPAGSWEFSGHRIWRGAAGTRLWIINGKH